MDKKDEREFFIKNNLPLVHSLAKRFIGKGVEYDDLFSSGCVGLVKAADNFNKDLGLCFSTYAVPVILGEIRRLFRDGGSVKVSRSLKELYIKTIREKERLSKNLGREPTLSEIAGMLGVTKEQISEAVSAARPTVSLSVGDDDSTKQFDLPDSDKSDLLINKIAIKQIIEKLDDDEKILIDMRYYRMLTQNETAKKLKMTQVQVSRKEKKILLKMRNMLGNAS